ncbi:cyclase family protein [Cryobacterium algoritolerans]|uniref:Cyclase family protein n=1 Tax=Cryobacterium algoritolerans TaxID=1259184 RepID=A0A4R8WZY6_9MICO|nr:cyclase family protein [Cryobacterium algoritolerans]TFC17638.1 cyclase family protein [Cryobacterium algoritolerans]
MKIISVVDLSVAVNTATQVYPGDPVPRFEVHSTIERDGFNLLSVSMGSQTGTHVDAPYHFDESAPKLDALPLGRFIGPGVIVDARDVGARGRITWRHIEPVAHLLEPGSIVLLHTGWSTHYGTDRYFDNPFLDARACARLIDLGIRTFGIDAINIDETPDETHPGEGFPVHHLIADVAGVISENLTNLASIDFAGPVISLLPIAFEAADGAPVRAVALHLEM